MIYVFHDICIHFDTVQVFHHNLRAKPVTKSMPTQCKEKQLQQ